MQDQRIEPQSSLPLFPAIEPYDSGTLEVAPPHRLYYEQSGWRH